MYLSAYHKNCWRVFIQRTDMKKAITPLALLVYILVVAVGCTAYMYYENPVITSAGVLRGLWPIWAMVGALAFNFKAKAFR